MIVGIYLLTIVIIATICIINVSFYFVSMASTIANIFGALLLLSWICILGTSIKYLLNKL